jgi:L-2-hydroxyglutarate oxidase
MVVGGVECGPNAVLALAREGYTWRDVSLRDTFDALTYPGFLRLAARHWRTGLGEVVRSLSRAAFVRALQRLVPDVRAEHLVPAPAGVRAQALDRKGSLVDDFVIEPHAAIVHVLNAPSPAATSALSIARHVVDAAAASGALPTP